jgi:hypothetical protein
MPVPTSDGSRRGADLRPDSLFYEIFVLAGRQAARDRDGQQRCGPGYAVYSVVFGAESVTSTAMAAALAMPLTAVMDWIGLMERRGHARRRPHPSDGRATR